MSRQVSASVKDRILAIFDPVELLTWNKYSRRVKAKAEWVRELGITEHARGVGGTASVKRLNELVVDGVLGYEEPFFAYIFKSPVLQQVVDEATEDEKLYAKMKREGALESRPKWEVRAK